MNSTQKKKAAPDSTPCSFCGPKVAGTKSCICGKCLIKCIESMAAEIERLRAGGAR